LFDWIINNNQFGCDVTDVIFPAQVVANGDT
jgi:hypothetical protein